MSGRKEKEKIVSALEGLTRVVELKTNAGSVLITEYGARILGVFMGKRRNPFWVAEDLRDIINRLDWNIGGNRLWVSPERNFFYKNPEKFEEWFCQRSLDPGSWRIISCGNRNVILEEASEIKDFLSNTEVHALLSRQISVSDAWLKRNLAYVKIRIRDAIAARGVLRNGIALWALTQIRPGEKKSGTVIIPTRQRARPIHYFGKIPGDRLRVFRDHVSFKIDGSAVYKLGIAPEDIPQCSEILYYVEHDNEAFLLSMRTAMTPTVQEECLDVAKAEPSGPRGCVQSYNSGPDLCFGEMELHFKPAVGIKDLWVSYADYDVDVFAGSRGEALRVLRKIIPKPFLFQR